MKNLKIGDIVWTIQTGYAKVTSTNNTVNYPIVVDEWASYTIDGKFGCRDKYFSLYLTNPFLDDTVKNQIDKEEYDYICNQSIKVIQGVIILTLIVTVIWLVQKIF